MFVICCDPSDIIQKISNVKNVKIDPIFLSEWFSIIKTIQNSIIHSKVAETCHENLRNHLDISGFVPYLSSLDSKTNINADKVKNVQEKIKLYEASNHKLDELQHLWWRWWRGCAPSNLAMAGTTVPCNPVITSEFNDARAGVDLSDNCGEYLKYFLKPTIKSVIRIVPQFEILPSITKKQREQGIYENHSYSYTKNIEMIQELYKKSNSEIKSNYPFTFVNQLNPFECNITTNNKDLFIQNIIDNDYFYFSKNLNSFSFVTIPFLIQFYVSNRDQLVTFFQRMKSLLIPGGCIYTCAYNEKKVLQNMIAIDKSYIQGNTSCCWNIEKMDIKEYQSYYFYWEGKQYIRYWISLEEIKFVGSLIGFNCIEQTNLFDIRDLFIDLNNYDTISINEWNTSIYFDCLVLQKK